MENPKWLLAGDFNLIFDNVLDRKNNNLVHHNQQSAKLVREYMDQNDIVDIWRCMNPTKRRYSFRRGSNVASRIDFFLISDNMMSGVKTCDILPSIMSDHSALYIEMELSDSKRGRGFWKLNTKWLKNKEYQDLIKASIESILVKNQQEGLNPSLSWEMLKNEIVSQTIVFSVNKARESKKEFQELEEIIHQIENEIDQLHDTNEQELANIVREYIFLKTT